MIAPKFKALGKAREFPLDKPKVSSLLTLGETYTHIASGSELSYIRWALKQFELPT